MWSTNYWPVGYEYWPDNYWPDPTDPAYITPRIGDVSLSNAAVYGIALSETLIANAAITDTTNV